MSLQVEWDDRKASQILAKHGVSFEEAATVFTDSLSLTITDPLHSQDAPRFILLGESLQGELLVVVHVDRGGVVRIISAREATRRESKDYESGRIGRI